MNETSIEKAVMDIITEVDLQEKTDVAAKKLSGGQKRKLSVGIALIGDPKIIFLGKYFMHMKYVLTCNDVYLFLTDIAFTKV